MAERKKRGRGAGATPALEWVVAAIGAVLVIGAIGYMLYRSVAGDREPPDVAVTAGEVVPFSGGWLVRIEAVNTGGETVANLRVVGELRDGERVIETSDAVLAYLPAGSRRGAGLFFRNDPRRLHLVLRPAGYEEP